jgi:hypothetical protein
MAPEYVSPVQMSELFLQDPSFLMIPKIPRAESPR